MRKNLLLTCLFAGTALSSCIRADLSDCQGHEPEPEETRQLIYFRYTGDGTSDLLADKIKFADLYVFDENEQLVQTKGISTEELAATHGTTLQLPAGNYRLVCLANTGERTQTSDLGTGDINNMYFAHPAYFSEDETSLTGNDPVYHGALTLQAEEGTSRDTIDFHASHLNVYLEIAGYDTMIAGRSASAPLSVTFEHAPCRVFFDNRVCPSTRTYHPELRKEGGQDLYIGQLNTYRLDENHPMQVCLHNGGADPFYTLDVMEFVSTHPEIDLSKEEADLPIRIEFRGKDVNVSITVPKWDIEEVFPDIDFE